MVPIRRTKVVNDGTLKCTKGGVYDGSHATRT